MKENVYNEDAVINPAHHKNTLGDLEYIEVMEIILTREEFIGHLKGQIYKYLLRAGKKDPLAQDLKKSEWYQNYLNRYLERSSKGETLTAKKVVVNAQ